MQYTGGKYRQGPVIADFVAKMISTGDIYVEPFCGALGVATKVRWQTMWMNDISRPLILMWRGLLDGSISLDDVPDNITRGTWSAMKYNRDENDWMTALVGHGLSFNGRYFEAWVGYTDTGRLKRSIERKLAAMRGKQIQWTEANYLDMVIGPNVVIYCDPPYEGAKRVHNSEGGNTFSYDTYYGWCAGQYLMGRKILTTGRVRPTVGEWDCLYDWGDSNPWYSRNDKSKGDGPSERLWVPSCQRYLIGL